MSDDKFFHLEVQNEAEIKMAGTQVFRVFGCAVSVLRGNAAAVCGERHGKERICFSHLRRGNRDGPHSERSCLLYTSGILERYSGAMDLSAAGGSEILRIIINN